MKTIPQLVQQLKNTFSDRKNIAPVESSSTASRAYAVGKKFFYNNILYRCTVAIASGGTITPGTNCVAESDVETQIDNAVAETSSLKETLTKEVTTRATLGAHNLFELKFTTQVLNGITCTVNSDKSITINGTNSGTASWGWLGGTEKFKLNIPSGDYIVSGAPSGATTSNYCLKFYDEGDGTSTVGSYPITDGKDVLVHIDNTHYFSFYLWVGANQTVSNVTFKPMIRLATDTDSTYQPYAMTNKELTDELTDKYLLTGVSRTRITADGVKTYRTLLQELFSALNTEVAGKTKDYYRINFLQIGSNVLRSNINGHLLMRGSGGIYSMRFDSVAMSGSHYYMRYAETSSSTLTNNNYFSCDNGTVTNQNNNVPTSGTEFIVYYDIYSKLV